jgi:hypothetical protein
MYPSDTLSSFIFPFSSFFLSLPLCTRKEGGKEGLKDYVRGHEGAQG